MTEKKIKTIIQVSVIAAVSLLLVLLVTIIVQCAVRANLSSRERMLQKQLDSYRNEASSIEDDIEYRKTQEYIEKYARETLGLVKDGEIKYVAK